MKGPIAVAGAGADATERQAGKRNKPKTFENCAPFTYCISKIINT